ncbi:MAG: SagB/ThcOx family dehydrogenase [Bacteroidales bacterium]|nr:SagB/ThcOx family dehydrogenase [Bacteroidales bacterium]
MSETTIVLPPANISGSVTVEKALYNRRSRRNIISSKIGIEEVSQILWAAYGITEPKDEYNRTTVRLKTTPSAGTIYPLKIYLVAGLVDGLKAGIYSYRPVDHSIILLKEGDYRKELSKYSMNHTALEDAPFSLIYTTEFEHVKNRHHLKSKSKYAFIEVGHSSQNVHLQAESLHLATFAIAAFEEKKIKQLIELNKEQFPLYIMPVGKYNKSED